MIPTQKYVRKLFTVDAVQITAENMKSLADWSLGEIDQEGDVSFIRVKVARVINDRQTKGYVGDWILHAGGGFKVYTNKAFERSFDLLSDEIHELMTTTEKLNTVSTSPYNRPEEKTGFM